MCVRKGRRIYNTSRIIPTDGRLRIYAPVVFDEVEKPTSWSRFAWPSYCVYCDRSRYLCPLSARRAGYVTAAVVEVIDYDVITAPIHIWRYCRYPGIYQTWRYIIVVVMRVTLYTHKSLSACVPIYFRDNFFCLPAAQDLLALHRGSGIYRYVRGIHRTHIY